MWLIFCGVVNFCSTFAMTSNNNTPVYTISEGTEMVLKFWFADNSAFNESCVAEACPALNNFNLCPNATDFSVLREILKTVTGCMRETFCGTTIDRGPCPCIAATAEEWLNGIEIDGMATLIPGTSYLSNLSNIEFEIQPNQDPNLPKFPLNIAVRMPNLRVGYAFRMDLSLRTLQSLIAGQALSFTIPEAAARIEAEFLSTIAINRSISGSQFEIKLIDPVIKAKTEFCGLDMPKNLQNLENMIYTMTQVIIDKSSWAISQGTFLEKFFQSVFSIVSKSC